MSGEEWGACGQASSDGSTKVNQCDSLHDEEVQFRPSYREGSRRYTNKFLRAVGASMGPIGSANQSESPMTDTDQEAPFECELEYEEGMFSPNNPEGYKKYSIDFLRAVGRLTRLKLDPCEQRVELYSQEKLPYEPNQYSPTNTCGDKKYSLKFLKAVGEMLMPDEDATEIAPFLSERTIFPWDLHVPRPHRHRELTRTPVNGPTKPADDIWI